MFSQHFTITNRPTVYGRSSSELALNILHFLLKLAAASSNLLVSENEVVKTSEVEVIMFAVLTSLDIFLFYFCPCATWHSSSETK